MTLFLEGFRWGGGGELRDGDGRLRFRLLGQAYRPGRRLHLRDLADREAASVRLIVPSLPPRFELETYGKPLGEAVRDPGGALCLGSLRLLRDPDGPGLLLCRDEIPAGECRPAAADPERLRIDFPSLPEGLPALALLLTGACFPNAVC